MGEQRRYASPAVERALSILETLASAQEIGVTELANKLGAGKSSVFRLLAALAAKGYVEKNPATERYRLTYKLFVVGSAAAERYGLKDVAAAVMDRLSAETGETVNLGVLEQDRVVNLHKVEAPQLLRMHLQVGRGVPAHATALGKVLLAGLEPADLDRWLKAHRLTGLTPHTITERRALRRALRQAAERGYSLDNEECSVGLRCVAAAIRDRRGTVVAAVSISGPTRRLPLETIHRLVGPVRAAALEISRRLGYAGPG
jgi:DNA-binding IclR family transcriptional regulator